MRIETQKHLKAFILLFIIGSLIHRWVGYIILIIGAIIFIVDTVERYLNSRIKTSLSWGGDEKMKKDYVCQKDWTIDSGTYYEKGKTYKGVPYNEGRSVKMYGECGMTINFHIGSDYFNVQ